jgi:hypothetical protein
MPFKEINLNTFQRDNPNAYTGLGVLGLLREEDLRMGGKIGGVRSSEARNFGLRVADGGVVTAGLGLGLIGEQCPETTITVERAEQLGVYRPNLEDRKVGKVGMHMVIDGFPRALREVAKVMTWAADAKGYKLHDWRNLPNADVAFPSAEYRHQNDNSIMKSEGTPAIERTDHESNLLHAAHKIFNGLAELELILTGVIK